MSAKHSPGPWFIKSLNMSKFTMSVQVGRIDGARKKFLPLNVTIETSEANARLIAAAPELLEGLKNAVTLLNAVGYVDGDVVDAARAAIAKVEG